ncbi:MAG: hypothetical protein JXQ99_24645 [Hyphomicrobiaceae bacterium]
MLSYPANWSTCFPLASGLANARMPAIVVVASSMAATALGGCGIADHAPVPRMSSYGPAISYSMSTTGNAKQNIATHRLEGTSLESPQGCKIHSPSCKF